MSERQWERLGSVTGIGFVVAMVTSAILDLPTGATVVCAFGLILLVLAIATRLAGRAAPA